MYDTGHANAFDVGSTSSKLLSDVRQNHSNAWQQLAETYGPLIYGWCRKRGLQSQCSADIVQDVLMAVSRNVDRFSKASEMASFRAWLWTITQNKIRDNHRKNSRTPVAFGGSDAQHAMGNVPTAVDAESCEEPGKVNQRTEAILDVLEEIRKDFSEQTWNAFWLVTTENMTSSTVAKELEMSPNAVRLAKSRVLRRLRSAFQLNEGDDQLA